MPGSITDARTRALAPLAIAAYVLVALGALGLEVRPHPDASAAAVLMSRFTTFLWAAGALIAIPTALRRHWLEKVGTAAVMGGTLIALADAVLLDVLPTLSPLSRPVVTITALSVAAVFFAARLADLRYARPRVSADDEIERADRLRGMTA